VREILLTNWCKTVKLFLYCCIADVKVKEELVNSSWCGVLAGLTVLLDARCGLFISLDVRVLL